MVYQLAEMAGIWDVKVIENGLSAKGLLGWEAYFGLEPRGEERTDYRTAQIVGMIFNMAVDVKNRKPFTDWLLKFEEKEAKKQPTKEQIAKKQFELLSIYARAYQGSEPAVDTPADRLAQKKLQEQVAQAHAAMKET